VISANLFWFQFFNDLLFLYVRLCVGKSDWSEIDQVFSSDDEELFGYFETGSNFNNKAQSVQSNDGMSDGPGRVLHIQKSKVQRSAEANYYQGATSNDNGLMATKTSAFSPFMREDTATQTPTE